MFDSVYVTFRRGTHLNFCPYNVVCGSSNHLNTPLAFLPSQLDNIFCFFQVFFVLWYLCGVRLFLKIVFQY